MGFKMHEINLTPAGWL